MKKRILAAFCLSPVAAFAGQSIYAPGTLSTMGNTTISHFLGSVIHNPAAGHLVVSEQNRYRFSYLNGAGFYVEYGEAENFAEELDELVDLLDESNITLDEADETLDRFNTVLQSLSDSGYVKGAGDLPIPVFPLVMRSDMLGGTVTLDVDAAYSFKSNVLTTEFSTDGECQSLLCLIDETYQTKTSLYIKGAEQLRLGVGYSRPVYLVREGGSYDGDLIVGAKVNLYSMSLSKQVIALETIENDDISDVIEEDYDNNQEDTNAIGLDVGLIYAAKRFQVGLTFANINEPEFDFGEVGTDCLALSGSSLDNCFSASEFADLGLIAREERHVMSALTTLDASVAITPNWYLAASYDLGEYNDPVGDLLQLFTLSTTVQSSSWMIPTIRFGYRANLAGEELSSASIGTTLFGVANLDILVGLDSTEVDGDSLPRNFAINFGFEERF